MECLEDERLCKLCENEYYPDEYGGCSYTDNCIISQNGRCLKCKDNNILIGIDNNFNPGIKICKSLNSYDLQNCELINYEDGSCLKCKNGYFLGDEDKKCTNIQFCVESVYGECIKCKENYYLNKKENTCLEQNGIFNNCKETKDGKICDKCNFGYYFDEYGKCSYFNYCAKINKEGICSKCKNGYYLAESRNSCTQEKNCLNGNKDFGICEIFNFDYYLDLKDRKCKSNNENNNFQYCKQTDEVCKNCIYGYEIGEDNKCSTSHNCIESNDGICYKCKEGYHLGLDNKCTNIEHYIYSDIFSQCIECEDNYFYDRANKTCFLTNENFTNCRAGYAEFNCQECKNDFYLNQTDHKCYDNKKENEYYKCAIISSPGDKCLKCIEGYFLGEKDGKCSQVEGCVLSENEKRCLECDDVYYCLNVKDGQCYEKDEIYEEGEKFYFRCNKTNEEGTACEICEDNYFLDENGLCVDIEHCIDKKDGICQDCLKDENNSFCLNNIFVCVQTYDSGCLECNDILNFDYNCTKCLDGFEYDEFFYKCRKIED